jgi:ABC-type antimicrobial peptide transport system permease subunit
MSNVTVRGVSESAFQVRTHIRMIEGRLFNSGSREIVVGKAVQGGFEGTNIGEKIKFANDQWTIVGIFSADGSAFESELWGDSRQLQAAFNRQNTVSTLTLTLSGDASVEDIKKAFESDRRLAQYEPKTEIKFYQEQSELLAQFIGALGTAVTFIFSFGAIIGAVITMYTAVSNRTQEIGTLRALGFRRKSVLFSFLIESVLLAAAGGVVGIVLASVLQFFSISTMNFNSFSELSFAFSLSPDIVINSMIFAVMMGVVGGFFPSIRAARLKIVDALRNE